MTYIARTRQWLNSSTAQWSRSSPGHRFCSKDTNAKKPLRACVCVCVCAHVHRQAFPLPPTQCPLPLQSPAFISASSRIQFATSYILLLPLAAVQHAINTDFTWQLANNSMSLDYWGRTAKDRRWERGRSECGCGLPRVCSEWCSWVPDTGALCMCSVV